MALIKCNDTLAFRDVSHWVPTLTCPSQEKRSLGCVRPGALQHARRPAIHLCVYRLEAREILEVMVPEAESRSE